MASEWQTAFVVSHKMPWCALLSAVKHYNKSLQKLQDFFFKTETKTKTFIFVLEAPRDQDPGLKDYITASEQARRLRLELVIVIGRYTENTKTISGIKKPIPIPTSVFEIPKNTEYQKLNTEKSVWFGILVPQWTVNFIHS